MAWVKFTYIKIAQKKLSFFSLSKVMRFEGNFSKSLNLNERKY